MIALFAVQSFRRWFRELKLKRVVVNIVKQARSGRFSTFFWVDWDIVDRRPDRQTGLDHWLTVTGLEHGTGVGVCIYRFWRIEY